MTTIEVNLVSGRQVSVSLVETGIVAELYEELGKILKVPTSRITLIGCNLPHERPASDLHGIALTAVVRQAWKLLTGEMDCNLRLWDLDALKCVCVLEDTAPVKAVSADFTVQRALGLCSDGTLSLWDLEEFEQLSYYSDVHLRNALRRCTLSADFHAERCLVAFGTKTLTLLDLGQMVPIGSLDASGNVSLIKADFARMLAVGAVDKNLEVWDLQTLERQGCLCGHSGCVGALAIDCDSRRAISGSLDCQLGVWDLVSMSNICFLSGHEGTVYSVSLDWNKHRAISGSGDKTIRIWNLSTLECVSILRGHVSPVNFVSLDSEAQRLVSFEDDKKLLVWQLSSKECVGELELHGVRSITTA